MISFFLTQTNRACCGNNCNANHYSERDILLGVRSIALPRGVKVRWHDCIPQNRSSGIHT